MRGRHRRKHEGNYTDRQRETNMQAGKGRDRGENIEGKEHRRTLRDTKKGQNIRHQTQHRDPKSKAMTQ